MGQAYVCEADGAIGGPGNGQQGDLLPREKGAGPLAFCSCLPSKPFLNECTGGLHFTKAETIRIEEEERTADIAADVVDGTSAKLSHLVLARHRVLSPHSQCKFKQYYRNARKIGEGSYGNVYEASTLPIDPTTGLPVRIREPEVEGADEGAGRLPLAPGSRRVAVKAFSMENSKQDDSDKAMKELQGRRASFDCERAILSQLEHPHIIKMHECFEEKACLYIVLELCRGGELYERIANKAKSSKNGGGLDEQVTRTIFRQMLHAVSYLHANQVVHRDIKSENFLLLGEAGTPDADTIKLCDFGTAAVLTPQRTRCMERIGTLSYTAPEIYASQGANTCADNWSLGVVMYVILVGASPFRTHGNETREDTMKRIQQANFETRRPAWMGLTPDAKDLIRKFLVIDENVRLTAKRGLRHPWLETGSARTAASLQSPKGSSAIVPATLADYEPYGSTLMSLLVRFANLDAMQQLILVVCAQSMGDVSFFSGRSEVPWYDLFFALDRNEDGQLSFEEFAQGLSQILGPSSNLTFAQLNFLVRALDLNCSGYIEWAEWIAVALLAEHHLLEDDEPLSTSFRLLDRPSGDATVGVADLLAVINSDAKSMFITSTAGREQVFRILTRWAPQQPSRREGSKCVVSAPSLKLPDMRCVLESSWKGEQVLTVPSQPVLPPAITSSWIKSASCGSCGESSVFPDAKTEMQVMVKQKRAFGSARGDTASPSSTPESALRTA